MKISLPKYFSCVIEYSFHYNGMESDPEVSGSGNSYTTQFRQYDPRLGRWKSLDPLAWKYTSQSPYNGFNCNPIIYKDPNGGEGIPAVEFSNSFSAKYADLLQYVLESDEVLAQMWSMIGIQMNTNHSKIVFLEGDLGTVKGETVVYEDYLKKQEKIESDNILLNTPEYLERYAQGVESTVELMDMIIQDHTANIGVKDAIDKFCDEVVVDKENTIFVVVNQNTSLESKMDQYCAISTLFHELLEHVSKDIQGISNADNNHHDQAISTPENPDAKASKDGTNCEDMGPPGSLRFEYKSRLRDIFDPRPWVVVSDVTTVNDAGLEVRTVVWERTKWTGEVEQKTNVSTEAKF